MAGIAWETGVLLGLTEGAPQIARHLLAEQTRYIGTSAGSTVAAQLASGTSLHELFDSQVAGAARELAVSIDLQAFGSTMVSVMAGAASPEEARRRIGALARAAETPAPSVRRAVIESRLPSRRWPSRQLQITAVDTETGELRVFDESSGVDLVDAVAASCAVPGIWPPVEIGGAFYMDGGTRTSANADLAAGAERVLILVPGPEVSPFGPAVPSEELALLAEARVHVVYADEGSLVALGTNPLDPGRRDPAAEAGRQVGWRAAAAVAALWG